MICSIDGLSDKNIVREDVIKALTVDFESYNPRKITDGLFAFIKETALSVYNLKEMNLFNDVIDSVLSGDTCFFMDGCAAALSIDTKKWKTRQIEEPDTETVIRGPREGFTENLQDNTSLLRRKIKNPNLVFKNIVLGKQTNTNVSICYIDGIANKNIIEEVKKRLKTH